MFKQITLIVATLIFLAFVSTNVDAASSFVYVFNTSTGDISYSAPDMVRSNGALVQIITDVSASCRFSTTAGIPYQAMERVFDYDSETIHKQYFTELNDGVYVMYIRCKDLSSHVSGELRFSFSVSTPISAKITLSKEPPLSAGQYVVSLKTSKPSGQPPTLSYSFDSVSYTPIPLAGNGLEWTGYLIIPQSIGEASGSFKFNGKDFEGLNGDFITSGSIFFVDTVSPPPIVILQAIGYEGNILLKWHEDKENKLFKIYRSLDPNVGYEDYFKDSLSTTFSDTSVERGRTYYYRVSAIDDARNEGDLSIEVYATALFANVSSRGSSALSVELVSLVDGALSEINYLSADVRRTLSSLGEESQSKKELFDDLRLERDIQSALTELDSLSKDVENYKTQSMSRAELERKIASVKVRLSAIKRTVPEEVTVLSEQSFKQEITEDELQRVFITLYPESAARGDDRIVKKTLEAVTLYSISIKRIATSVSVVYLDGTREEFALIREYLSSSLPHDGNYSFIESIPPGVASSVNDLSIKNPTYDMLKEDTILSFETDTEKIVYTIPSSTDISDANEILSVPLFTGPLPAKPNGITGYFSSVASKRTSIAGIILGAVIAMMLGGYYFYLRKDQSSKASLLGVRSAIQNGRAALSANNYPAAQKIYESLAQSYRDLPARVQERVYNLLEEFHHELLYHDLEKRLAMLKSKQHHMNEEELRESVHSLHELYRQLPERYQNLLAHDYEDIFTLR